MQKIRLQIRTVAHDAPWPDDDEAQGMRLVEWVRRAVESRKAPPAAVVVREGRTDLVAISQVQASGLAMPRFIAGLTRSTIDASGPARAVGVIGVLPSRQRGREGGPSVPMAVSFLEWPDNRWWYWRALLEPETGAIREDTESVTRAIEGDPMPAMLGRWWAAGRRANLRMHLSADAGAENRPQTPMVH